MKLLEELSCQKFKVSEDLISDLYTGSTLVLDNSFVIPVNSYALFQSEINEKQTAIVQYLGKNTWKLKDKQIVSFQKLSPKDLEQKILFDVLNKDIPLNMILGSAGTGKTTIALAYALEQFEKANKDIILIKPAIQAGNSQAFGAVPGDINEKYAPYLLSYTIAMQNILGKHSSAYIEAMTRKEQLKFIPLELLRGVTLDNATVILDECQNVYWNELNTLISRIGINSKLLVLGDLTQVDLPCSIQETGLYQLLNATPFIDSDLKSITVLRSQYRSPIVKLITEVNEWLKNKE